MNEVDDRIRAALDAVATQVALENDGESRRLGSLDHEPGPVVPVELTPATPLRAARIRRARWWAAGGSAAVAAAAAGVLVVLTPHQGQPPGGPGSGPAPVNSTPNPASPTSGSPWPATTLYGSNTPSPGDGSSVPSRPVTSSTGAAGTSTGPTRVSPTGTP